MKFLYINHRSHVSRRVKLIKNTIEELGQSCDVIILPNKRLREQWTVYKRVKTYPRSTKVLFDDFTLIPLVFILRMYGLEYIYNRQEIPLITIFQRIQNLCRLDWLSKVLLLCFKLIEDLCIRFSYFTLTIPIKSSFFNSHVISSRKTEIVGNYLSRSEVSSNISTKPGLNILYFGEISKQNGFDKLLQLALIIKRKGSFQLQVAGIDLTGEFESEIKRLKLESVINYYGHVSYDRLTEIAENSVCGLAFSDPEYVKYKHMDAGSSRKILTYSTFALPCIAIGKFGHELKKYNLGLYFSKLSASELYDHINEIRLNIDFAPAQMINNRKKLHSFEEIFGCVLKKRGI